MPNVIPSTKKMVLVGLELPPEITFVPTSNALDHYTTETCKNVVYFYRNITISRGRLYGPILGDISEILDSPPTYLHYLMWEQKMTKIT